MKTLIFWMSFVLMIMVSSGYAAELIVPDQYYNLQSAIDAAEPGDTVVLQDGEYSGRGFCNLSFNGKAITVTSANGNMRSIIRGPENSETDRAFIFDSGETSDAVLSDITISDFYTPLSIAPGLYIFRSAPTILRCRFVGNETWDSAGAIYIREAPETFVVSECEFKNNKCDISGGALCVVYSDVALISCRFIENRGSWDGGALNLEHSTGKVMNCIFESNVADSYYNGMEAYGGAVGAWWSSAEFVNCLFANNVAKGFESEVSSGEGLGGAMFLDGTDQEVPYIIENCTFVGNSWEIYGSSSTLYANTEVIIQNSIIWHNLPDDHLGIVPVVRYCNIERGCPGEGNIDADPLFVSMDDLHMDPGSPCKDAGYCPSSEIYFEVPGGTRFLSELTILSDESRDTGTADLGYHYVPRLTTPTPTPSPTFTPTPEPSCSTMGVTLHISALNFQAGDTFSLQATVCNTELEPLKDAPLFVILDVFNEPFFAPEFSSTPSYIETEFAYGSTTLNVIPAFIWPEGAGTAQGLNFYAALTDPVGTDILGDWDAVSFSYGS